MAEGTEAALLAAEMAGLVNAAKREIVGEGSHPLKPLNPLSLIGKQAPRPIPPHISIVPQGMDATPIHQPPQPIMGHATPILLPAPAPTPVIQPVGEPLAAIIARNTRLEQLLSAILVELTTLSTSVQVLTKQLVKSNKPTKATKKRDLDLHGL